MCERSCQVLVFRHEPRRGYPLQGDFDFAQLFLLKELSLRAILFPVVRMIAGRQRPNGPGVRMPAVERRPVLALLIRLIRGA